MSLARHRVSSTFDETIKNFTSTNKTILNETKNMNETVTAVSQEKTSGMAVTSLIIGILSVLGGAMFLIPPILAVIFGHVSVSACNKNPNLTGKGMGIAGLVMGWLGLAGWIIFFFFIGGLAVLGGAASASGY